MAVSLITIALNKSVDVRECCTYSRWRGQESPPREEGRLRSKQMSRSHRSGADGGVAYTPIGCERPPRPLQYLRLRATALAFRAREASRHFMDVASTPPLEPLEEGIFPLAMSLFTKPCERRNGMISHVKFVSIATRD